MMGVSIIVCIELALKQFQNMFVVLKNEIF